MNHCQLDPLGSGSEVGEEDLFGGGHGDVVLLAFEPEVASEATAARREFGVVHTRSAPGLGGALYVEFRYDADGGPRSTTFAEYGLPGSAEVPDVLVRHLGVPTDNPLGVRGAGESGTIAVSAAEPAEDPDYIRAVVADALASSLTLATAARRRITHERPRDPPRRQRERGRRERPRAADPRRLPRPHRKLAYGPPSPGATVCNAGSAPPDSWSPPRRCSVRSP